MSAAKGQREWGASRGLLLLSGSCCCLGFVCMLREEFLCGCERLPLDLQEWEAVQSQLLWLHMRVMLLDDEQKDWSRQRAHTEIAAREGEGEGRRHTGSLLCLAVPFMSL